MKQTRKEMMEALKEAGIAFKSKASAKELADLLVTIEKPEENAEEKPEENIVSCETTTPAKQTAKERKAAEKAQKEQERLMVKADLVSTVFTHMEEKGLVSYHWQGKMPNLMAVRAGKKTAAEIYLGKKDYRINVRQTVFDAAGIGGYVTINHYYLPACLKHIPLTDTETAVKVIDQIANLYAEYIPTQEQAAK